MNDEYHQLTTWVGREGKQVGIYYRYQQRFGFKPSWTVLGEEIRDM